MATFDQFYNLRVDKTSSEDSMSSNFVGVLENVAGRNKDTFNVGDDITIYADIQVDPPTTKIFTGIIEDIEYRGTENNEKITLRGRDYTLRLMDVTVEPEVYTDLPAGSIVQDIVNKYVSEITVNNVGSSDTIIDRIVFNHTPVYDAIKELADLSGYFFYVDTNKDLHFEEKSSVSSNQTFNNTNILTASFKEERDSVFNQIWVYGDRYLDNFEETFIAGSPLGGSVFSLLYYPHNTEVQVDAVTQVGGIFNISPIPASGTNYWVNFNDSEIVFLSGTSIGYSSVPDSGASVFIKYKRSLPIIKVVKNQESINTYGKRVKRIFDKNIKDPETAVQIANQTLSDLSVPKKEGTLKIKNLVDITPGETCTVDLPWHNINNQTYDIVSATYEFEKRNMLNNSSLTIKVNKKLNDATDLLKDLDTRIRKLESVDLTTSDIVTRLETTTGSVGLRASGIFIKTSVVTGSAWHIYATGFIPPINPWHLASGTDQGFLAGSFTGSASAFGPFITQWSGGFF